PESGASAYASARGIPGASASPACRNAAISAARVAPSIGATARRGLDATGAPLAVPCPKSDHDQHQIADEEAREPEELASDVKIYRYRIDHEPVDPVLEHLLRDHIGRHERRHGRERVHIRQ